MEPTSSPLLDTTSLYRALLSRSSEYEGLAFVGVRTTGIFCRLTCSAKKPKRENCEFFPDVRSAIVAGYRACLRCRPLAKSTASPLVERLQSAIEAEPSKRWSSAEVRTLGIDPSTARRVFRARYGMTFVEFARTRRLGQAFRELRRGAPVIEAQQAAEWESGSGFRDAFRKVLGAPPAKAKGAAVLYSRWVETPLGPMVAVGDEGGVYLLEFADRRGLEKELLRLRARKGAAIVPGSTAPLALVAEELAGYFAGTRADFTVRTVVSGSDFQRAVWECLLRIPVGQTRTYAQVASEVGRPRSVRAVARAVGSNVLALVIPCHRVVGNGGALTGYAGGLARKKWLLEHEARVAARASGESSGR
ncbi:MAG: trifunctional transcriptional activator/DNA repair protein Ada/methylated-DNA--[protein]-cysteine S-methyltransferase [Myxococcota bacterium]